jgi:hypothetical protein
MGQTIIILVVVALAAAILGRLGWRKVRGGSCGCGTGRCGGSGPGASTGRGRA